MGFLSDPHATHMGSLCLEMRAIDEHGCKAQSVTRTVARARTHTRPLILHVHLWLQHDSRPHARLTPALTPVPRPGPALLHTPTHAHVRTDDADDNDGSRGGRGARTPVVRPRNRRCPPCSHETHGRCSFQGIFGWAVGV